MPFPLYRRPGAVVFLDDDPDYLEMMAEVMPETWYVQLLLRPAAFIGILLKETNLADQDLWAHQEIINRWRDGAALLPQILKYWRENGTARFALARVCVVDYAMPAMNGLAVFGNLVSWPGSRILLTGRADEQLAVAAFNSGLIDQFVPKQATDIRQRLTDAITHLMHKPSHRYEQCWRATFTKEQNDMLGDPKISDALENLAAKQDWIEHVVIGVPFGILALDNTAQAMWLQLEPTDKLADLAEMAGAHGFDTSTVQQVRLGKKLIDLELQLALGSLQKATPRESFKLGEGSNCLHAALFEINEALCPKATDSYQTVLTHRGHRQVQD